MKKVVGFFSILLLFSCSVRHVQTDSKEQKEIQKVEKQAVVNRKNFNEAILNEKSTFNFVKMTSKINVENGSFVPELNATIYIENNKKIWVNLSAFFLSVARGVATPSGIKGYEKFGKNYIDSDFSYLNQLLGVDFIDYGAFQNLLVGKPLIMVINKNFEIIENSEAKLLLRTKVPQKFYVKGVEKQYQIELNYQPQSGKYNLQQIALQNPKTSEKLEIFYTNWEEFTQGRFPKNVKIVIKEQKVKQIFIENTKFDFSEMETPYSVPNHYQKIEIK